MNFKKYLNIIPAFLLALSTGCGLFEGARYHSFTREVAQAMEKRETRDELSLLNNLIAIGKPDCHKIKFSSDSISCYREQLVDEEGNPVQYYPSLPDYDDGIENIEQLVWETPFTSCKRVYTLSDRAVLQFKRERVVEVRYGYSEAEKVLGILARFCR